MPAGRSAIGATSVIGRARPTANASPTATPTAGSPTADHDPGEREDAECEDERGETEAEQDAVEARGDRHRHHPPPVLGKLAADLGHDRGASQLGERGGEGERRGERVGEPVAGAVDYPAERAKGAERHDAADEGAERERDARRQRGRAAAGVPDGPDRLDHREAARRPGPGQPGEEGGGSECELEAVHAQHGTLVWKYMTQKTLRPR